MYNFIVKNRPASFNSWAKNSGKGKAYKSIIETSVTEYVGEHAILTGELYRIVYHFFNADLSIDADNLSKPVWDCLENYLFKDDSQVKIRVSGNFDLTNNNYLNLNFSRLDKEIIDDLYEAFDTVEHIIYIECGSLDYSMYNFNIERNGI
jgi:Holliday junction resolvase RusA-like endonuclease